MKRLLFCLQIILAAIVANGQHIGATFNPADSTYILSDTTFTVDGFTINVRIVPAKQFANFIFSMALTEQARRRNVSEIQTRLSDKISVLIATVDSIAGAGTFNSVAEQNLQNSLAGRWKIKIEKEHAEQKINVLISGTDIAEVGGNRKGTVKAVGAESIHLSGFFQKDFVLKLKSDNKFEFKGGKTEIEMKRQ